MTRTLRRVRFGGALLLCTIISFCASIVISPAARAQGMSVHGVVRDSSGAVISGAHVQLNGKSYSVSLDTDATGSFTFENVPVMSGTIAISSAGMSPGQQNWTASAGGPT